MRKAGIKESHLASIVDVYRDVMFNALARIEEDEVGDAGPLVGAKKADDKGVRVSLFTAALGMSPYLFMREASRRQRWDLDRWKRSGRDVRAVRSIVEQLISTNEEDS